MTWSKAMQPRDSLDSDCSDYLSAPDSAQSGSRQCAVCHLGAVTAGPKAAERFYYLMDELLKSLEA